MENKNTTHCRFSSKLQSKNRREATSIPRTYIHMTAHFPGLIQEP